ncbi:MAG: T9SS type A sorting domain-containing protein, partial [Bacteroidota bacterium]
IFELPFTSNGVTDSGVNSSCSSSGNDQWFTWTATDLELLFNSLSPGYPGIAIFASCADAQTGMDIDCASRGDHYEILSGWEIGDELLIQVSGSSYGLSNIAFCLEIFAPLPNDFCTGAIPILPNPTGTGCTNRFQLPFITDGTTESGFSNSCSSGGYDQWFTWTATELELVFQSLSPGPPGIAVFANCTDAEAGIDIDCAIPGDIYEELSGWEIGDELLIQVYDPGTYLSNVEFCLTTNTRPINDFCAGATPIVPHPMGTGCTSTSTFTLPFASDRTTDSGVPNTCSISGKDQWFTWTATELELLFQSLSPGQPGINIFANCADAASGNEIDCAFPRATYERLKGWAIGDELLIQIYDFHTSTSDVAFCLEIVTPPPNDFCSGAIPILPQSEESICIGDQVFTLPFTSDYTSDSDVPTVCTTSGNDQWFTWTATSLGLRFNSLHPGEPGIAVYSSCEAASDGVDVDCAIVGANERILRGWEIGDELLLQIHDGNNQISDVAFCLAEVQAPVNDFCENAIELPIDLSQTCITPMIGDNLLASASGALPIPTCGNFSFGHDVWYKTNIPDNAYLEIEVAPASAYDPNNWAMAVYAGACGNLSLIDCVDNNGAGSSPAIELTDQTPGSTIYVRVWELGSNAEGAFTICAFSQLCDLEITAATPLDESCFGANDGSLRIHTSTSNPPVDYNLFGPIHQSNLSGEFNELSPGDYTVIVTDLIDHCADTTTVTIETGTPLIIDCSAIVHQRINCLDSLPAPDFDLSLVTSACGAVQVNAEDVVSNGTGCPGEAIIVERTFTLSDDQNTTTCVQEFTFESSIPPSINCPPHTTVACDAPASPSITGMATALSDCGIDNGISYFDQPITGVCSSLASIERLWTVIDDCSRIAECTQHIQVIDTVPPIAPLLPAVLTFQCADEVPEARPLIAADNCNGPVEAFPISVLSPGACANDFTIARTWIFDDGCGNSTSVSQNIIVRDTIPPVPPMAPANLLLQCSTDIPTANSLTANDNCGQAITVMPTEEMAPGDCPQQFTLIRTWVFEDSCGNGSSAVQFIEVNDSTPPLTPNPPEDLTIQCANDIPDAIALTAIDNCGTAITVMPSSVVAPGNCPTRFTLTRTWTFEDPCGNTASIDQNIEIIDNASITAVAPPDQTVDCAYNVIATPALVEVNTPCNSTYEVENLDIQLLEGIANCPEAVYQITYLATDACGRTATATQTFSIENEGPQFVCPSEICVIDCPSDTDQIWSTFNAFAGLATVNTSCSNLAPVIYNDFHPEHFIDVDCTNNSFGIPSVIEYQIVTFYATDVCGRTSTCTAMVVVKDTEAPQVSGEPYPAIRECDDLTQAEYEAWIADNMNLLSATDACSEVEWTYSPSSPNKTVWVNGFATTPVVFIASDRCGNSVSHKTKFTLKNNFPPSFVGELPDKTVDCDSLPLPFDLPELVHACGATLTHTEEVTPGHNPNEYSVTRTWTATDHTGSTSSTSQTIFVVDRISPHVGNAPEDLFVGCLEDVPPANERSVTDNCAGLLTAFPIDSQVQGSCLHEQVIVRTWTFTDWSGNTAELNQTIVVKDETPPFFTDVPPNGQQACGTAPVFGQPTFKDDCIGSVQLSWNDVSGGSTCSGFVTRTWVATDACGNTSTASQTIAFKDQEGPVFTAISPSQSISCDEFPPAFNAPLVEDACSEIVEISYEETFLSGSANSCLLSEDFDFQRTWIATDACGNVSTTKQVFEVRGNVGTGATRNEVDDTKASANPVFELLQNRPNPFLQETTIGFILPQASTVTLTVYDPSGKQVHQIKGVFKQGYNEISLNQSDLGASGIFYYQLDTPTHTATKRMIIY